MEVKKFYYEEKYRCLLKGKGTLFEKQYILLSNIYTKGTNKYYTFTMNIFMSMLVALLLL